MWFKEVYFIDPDLPKTRPELDNSPTCLSCTGTAFRPRKTKCGCLYCFPCSTIIKNCHCGNVVVADTLKSDPDIEEKISNLSSLCNNSSFGCKFTGNLFTDHECQFNPSLCQDCGQVGLFSNEKHACSFQCKCGSTVSLKLREYHDLGCLSLHPTPSPAKKIVKLQDFEINNSKNPITETISVLEQKYKSLLENRRTADITYALQSLINYQTVELQKVSSKKLVDFKELSDAYLNVGLLYHEYIHIRSLFKQPIKQSIKSNCTVEENGSLDDEVEGLLLSLGISKTATSSIKIKAIEAEYQRLVALGQTNQAAEVQGLYEYNLRKLKIVGDCGNEQKLNEITIENAIEKMRDAVECFPTSYNALLELSRILISRNQFKESIAYLRCALALKPKCDTTRLLLGIALINVNENEGILYLESFYSKFRHQFANNEGFLTIQRLTLDEKYVIDGLLLLSDALAMRNELKLSRQVLLDMRYNIPNLIYKTEKNSELFGYYVGILLNILVRLLKFPKSDIPSSAIVYLVDLLFENTTSKALIIENCISALKFIVSLDNKHLQHVINLGNKQLELFEINGSRNDLNDAKCTFMAADFLENGVDESVQFIESQNWWKAAVIDRYSDVVVPDPILVKTGTKAASKAALKAPSKPLKAPSKAPVKSAPKETPKEPEYVKTTKAATSAPKSKAAPVKSAAKADVKPTEKAKALSSNKSAIKESEKSPDPPPPKAIDEQKPVEKAPILKCFEIQWGLAKSYRLLLESSDNLSKQDLLINTEKYYRQAINISKKQHDLYIELASVLEQSSLESALNVYTMFPFDSECSQDDLYIHGELVRLFVKLKKYSSALEKSLIELGRFNGVKSIEGYLTKIDNDNQTALLKNVYAGINRKSIDDPELKAFFNSRGW